MISSGAGIVSAVAELSKAYEPVVVFETWVESTGKHPIPNLGHGNGELLFASRSASAIFAADGSRISCKAGASIGMLSVEVTLAKCQRSGCQSSFNRLLERP
jgi:hypothetical protein